MGRQPLVIVADAELCREVGIRKFKSFSNRSIPSPIAASPLHQKGLFFTRDSRWSTMRNTILSIYQPSHLAKLIPTMQDFIDPATQNLDSQDFTFSDLSLKLATDVIGKAAFGVDFGLSKPKSGLVSHEHDQVQGFINKHIYSTTQLKMDLSGSFSIILGLLIPILQEPFRQILKRIPGTMDWKVEWTNNNLSNRLDEIVHNRMKENDHSSKDCLLYLRARESETAAKNAFTKDYISAVTYEHLLAGSATTSFTLSTIIYLVAGHPEVEKKVVEEIDAFGRHDQMPTAHDLQHSFPYLDQVIKEAMRFYTVSPLVARETSAEVSIGGYVLPKNRVDLIRRADPLFRKLKPSVHAVQHPTIRRQHYNSFIPAELNEQWEAAKEDFIKRFHIWNFWPNADPKPLFLKMLSVQEPQLHFALLRQEKLLKKELIRVPDFKFLTPPRGVSGSISYEAINDEYEQVFELKKISTEDAQLAMLLKRNIYRGYGLTLPEEKSKAYQDKLKKIKQERR